MMRRHRRAANRYNHYSNTQVAVASRLWRAVMNHLDSNSALSVMELGCGTGNLTARFSDQSVWKSILAIDCSPEMIAVAQQRVIDPFVKFEVQDITQIQSLPDVDWIVSNETLHWVQEPIDLIQRWVIQLPTHTRWAFSVTLPESYPELVQLIEKGNPQRRLPVQHFLSVEEWQAGLARCFKNVTTEYWWIEEPFSSLISLLRTAQASWVSPRSNSPLSQSEFRRIESEMNETFGGFRLSSKVMVAICHN